MAVTLKAIYHRGCESTEGKRDSRRGMINVFMEVGIVWMVKVCGKIKV